MTISDETLMAYADGELEAAQRAEVEVALAADPQLARRVEQHQALRKKGAPRGDATVTDLRRVRAARAAEAKEAAAAARRSNVVRPPWTWREWGAMAASVVVGAVIAHFALLSPGSNRIGTNGGQLVAQGDLATALSNQLASRQQASSPVQIGVSFKSKVGDSCRTFTVKGENPLGGLACRQGNAWQVQVLASLPASAASAASYKPASGIMPAAVITALEQQIQGQPFDASAEAAAQAKGWK